MAGEKGQFPVEGYHNNAIITIAMNNLLLYLYAVWYSYRDYEQWTLSLPLPPYNYIIINFWLYGGLSQICSKIAQNAFGIFPKFLPIMLFKLSIMLVLCSNMNNIDVKILLLECFIRIFTI